MSACLRDLKEMKQKSTSTGSKKAHASAARLAAVQAVYQGQMNKKPLSSVIEEFIDYRAGETVDGEKMLTPDETLFTNIVKGVDDREDTLNDTISGALTGRESGRQIEPLLKSIMLCGAYELMAHSDIDAPIIISDYLHVTHAFYDQGEHSLVNAVLDNIKQNLREQN